MQTTKIPWLLKQLQPIDFPYKLGICENLFGSTLAAKGICWISTAAGIPWKLDLRNPTLRWIIYGKYEGPGFLNWAKNYLSLNSIVVDSGANIGQMLLYLAQWIPQGKVLAFEPNEKAANWLKECLALNPNLPVRLIKKGLGSENKRVFLKDEGVESKVGSQGYVSETSGVPIDVVRLGDELKKLAIEYVDLWKLDVEGYEIAALEGAQEFLKEKKIKAIYVEVRGENGLNIRKFLLSYGYRNYLINPNGKLYLADKFVNDGNALFLPA
jgi:FkbM family methyltransferase